MTKPIELTALALIQPVSGNRYGWKLAVCRNGRRCGTYYSDGVLKSKAGIILNASDMADAMNIKIDRWVDV